MRREGEIKLNKQNQVEVGGADWVQNYLSKPHVSFHFLHFPKTNSVIRQMLLFQYFRFRYVHEICFFFQQHINYFALQLLFRMADLCAELSAE